jgi:hypothetical protein
VRADGGEVQLGDTAGADDEHPQRMVISETRFHNYRLGLADPLSRAWWLTWNRSAP